MFRDLLYVGVYRYGERGQLIREQRNGMLKKKPYLIEHAKIIVMDAASSETKFIFYLSFTNRTTNKGPGLLQID